MFVWIYFLGAGVISGLIISRFWLRMGNPSQRTLLRRLQHSTRDEHWTRLQRQQQVEQWARPFHVRFFEGLDFLVSVICLVAVARALGMFDQAPTHHGNGTVVVNNLFAYAIWGIKFVGLIALVGIPVYLILRRINATFAKAAIYALIITVCGFTWPKERVSTRTELPPPAAKVMPAESAQPDPEDRETLVGRRRALDAQTRIRWRQDVNTAGAKGPPGLVPPMLELTQTAPFTWRVVNRSNKTACVSVARVARSAKDATSYERCPSDRGIECREIASGRSKDFAFYRNDRVRACAGTLFEFRVGSPLSPEPTFWSDSALQDFDMTVPKPATYAEYDSLRLRGEIAELEETLSERDRASRWRRELEAAPARQLETSAR